MVEAEKYALLVTAGPSYDTGTHQLVHVNKDTPVHVETPSIRADIKVRIKNYRGLPKDSPTSCEYFERKPHTSDLYSIDFKFTLPNSDEQDLTADDLLFGNDFDHPIRDNLPWGTSAALKIVKTTIDPGIDDNAYADKPYLYGPLFSSITALSIDEPDTTSSPDQDPSTNGVREGGSGRGAELRQMNKVPADVGGRRKFFLNEANRKSFGLTNDEAKGLEYRCDFFNPYLDFNEFALKLPGFSLGIMKFWDGQPLRYVLKLRGREDPLFVVSFTLIKKNEIEETAVTWGDTTKGSVETVEVGANVQDDGEASQEQNTTQQQETPQRQSTQGKTRSNFQDEGVD